jgi:hypothetical protein
MSNKSLNIISTILSFAALIVSYGACDLSKKAMIENRIISCESKIESAITSIKNHELSWYHAKDMRIALGEENVAEIQNTRQTAINHISALLTKASNEFWTNLYFERKLKLDGDIVTQKDNLLTYMTYLETIEVAHYAKKSELKILSSTHRSISELSQGIIKLLNKVECSDQGKIILKNN